MQVFNTFRPLFCGQRVEVEFDVADVADVRLCLLELKSLGKLLGHTLGFGLGHHVPKSVPQIRAEP